MSPRRVSQPDCDVADVHAFSDIDGRVTEFHFIHYGTKAFGGAGLVFLDTSAVLNKWLVGPGDIGIWEDGHIAGLVRLTDLIHQFDAKEGCQLGHAG